MHMFLRCHVCLAPAGRQNARDKSNGKLSGHGHKGLFSDKDNDENSEDVQCFGPLITNEMGTLGEVLGANAYSSQRSFCIPFSIN